MKLIVKVHEDEYDGKVDHQYSINIWPDMTEDHKLCALLAKGILFENDWVPGSVQYSWNIE